MPALRVLLVEDNPLNQELVCDLLEAAGHSVAVAPDGASFRARIANGESPDIILMDVLLPGDSGVILLDELRRARSHTHIPVVAVTAQVLTGDRERYLAAGFDGVMGKPIDTRTFVADVERHVVRAEDSCPRS